jgi:hypothetical protein
MTTSHPATRLVSFGPRALCALAMGAAATFGLVQATHALAQSMQPYFASPEQAGQALVDAVRAGDDPAVASILGPDAASALSSGDGNEDASAQKAFVRKYDAMHRWARLTDGSEILYVGADNYAYPFPLRQDGKAGWRFDGMAGTDEIQARRIGSNELLAMDATQAIAMAEESFKAKAQQYTVHIVSQPGKHDGLYWPAAESDPVSPLGDLRGLQACATCAEGSQLFDGYVFRILTEKRADKGVSSFVANGKMTDGFAVLATPANYGATGIMSFLIDRDGVLYEKDLGAGTPKMAAAMNVYDPNDGWELAR